MVPWWPDIAWSDWLPQGNLGADQVPREVGVLRVVDWEVDASKPQSTNGRQRIAAR
jgi:hypothetical protein